MKFFGFFDDYINWHLSFWGSWDLVLILLGELLLMMIFIKIFIWMGWDQYYE